MANFIETTPTSTAVLKFVDCCDQSEIFFRGTINLVPGTNVFSYEGNTPFVGAGGSLQLGRCYTVTQEYVSTTVTYPAAPVEAELSPRQNCTDLKCGACENPKACNCPEGFRESEGNLCIKTVTTVAEYSGQLLTLTTGNKSKYYCDAGLRLYPDISSLTWPIYGDGPDNGSYTVKQNNGSGALVAPIGNVQNEVWGKGSNPCWTNTSGGRLNIAGVWATGYPLNKELSFEFCITVDGNQSKQYLLGLAGDNYVKFYIDGNLAVFLNVPDDGTTVPFRYWHTFPITLTPGTHTIKLAGLNLGSSAAFAGEIYDISLSNFQANLMAPAVSAGNCGTSPAQLAPYIIFSTKDMVGKQVANPNIPGQWTCPDGGEVDFCNGTPSCYKRELLNLTCACYMIIPCDGTDAFVSNNEEFVDYVDGFVNVVSKSLEWSGCAYIVELEGNDCLDSVEAFPDPDLDVPCNCELKCYYVQGTNGFLYVDANDVLQEVSAIDATPNIKICSKVYPVVENNSQGYQIVDFGNCVDGECPTLCFKLENCDTGEIIYSNSDSLLPYLYSSNNIIQIVGRGGCWELSLPSGNCNCLVVTTTSSNPDYFPPFTATANAIGTYNGNNLYTFTLDGVDYYIWYNEKDQWVFSFDGYGDDNLDFEYIAITIETQETCPVSMDGTIEWRSIREGVDTTTDLCPAECDCPIDVTATGSYETCEDCIGYISYKLTSCTNNDIIYTLDDLSDYVNKVVKLDCGCYEVEQLDILPPNTQTVVIESVFNTCTECTRTYWKLTDCQDAQNTLITYSDLSLYEGKVIKVENCDECWQVEITDEFLNAGVVTVVTGYEDCIECGAPKICECTKVTNLNPETKTYLYYDCNNVLQQLVLASGQTSDKVCALEWLTESPYCKCIQFKIKGQSLYAFIIPGLITNGKPVYNLCDEQFDCGIVYWNGTNWVIESDGYISWILPISTSVLCPYGDWEEYEQLKPREKAAAAAVLTSQPCVDIESCDCFTLTTSEGETFTFYPFSIDINGNVIYINEEGQTISYDLKSSCWRFNIFQDFNYFLCQDIYTPCPIGDWNTPYGLNTAVSVLCPNNNQFTVYDYFETFGECKNGVCPPPVFKNNRTVRPGYNTPICTPEKYDEITCRFADILYKIALEKRYGITNCCPEEDDKWLIKKELIDLQALKDPNYNCPECICSCNSGKTYSTCNCKN
jgi:hypothetical protein